MDENGEKEKKHEVEKSRVSQGIANDGEGSSVTADTLSVPLVRVSLRIKMLPGLYQRVEIRVLIVNSPLLPHSSPKLLAPNYEPQKVK